MIIRTMDPAMGRGLIYICSRISVEHMLGCRIQRVRFLLFPVSCADHAKLFCVCYIFFLLPSLKNAVIFI